MCSWARPSCASVYLTLCLPYLQASDKKRIPNDEWERKLGEVKIRKEDMNKLVMNFFTTEVGVSAMFCCRPGLATV